MIGRICLPEFWHDPLDRVIPTAELADYHQSYSYQINDDSFDVHPCSEHEYDAELNANEQGGEEKLPTPLNYARILDTSDDELIRKSTLLIQNSGLQ